MMMRKITICLMAEKAFKKKMLPSNRHLKWRGFINKKDLDTMYIREDLPMEEIVGTIAHEVCHCFEIYEETEVRKFLLQSVVPFLEKTEKSPLLFDQHLWLLKQACKIQNTQGG